MNIMKNFNKYYWGVRRCVETAIKFYVLWKEWCRQFWKFYNEGAPIKTTKNKQFSTHDESYWFVCANCEQFKVYGCDGVCAERKWVIQRLDNMVDLLKREGEMSQFKVGDSKLKPCPFCGQEANQPNMNGSITCSDIDCSVVHYGLVEEWNRRAMPECIGVVLSLVKEGYEWDDGCMQSAIKAVEDWYDKAK